jgi:hypothetical protein
MGGLLSSTLIPLSKVPKTHISDFAQGPDSVGAIHLLAFRIHILLQTAGDNNYILRNCGELLNHQIDHATEGKLKRKKKKKNKWSMNIFKKEGEMIDEILHLGTERAL